MDIRPEWFRNLFAEQQEKPSSPKTSEISKKLAKSPWLNALVATDESPEESQISEIRTLLEEDLNRAKRYVRHWREQVFGLDNPRPDIDFMAADDVETAVIALDQIIPPEQRDDLDAISDELDTFKAWIAESGGVDSEAETEVLPTDIICPECEANVGNAEANAAEISCPKCTTAFNNPTHKASLLTALEEAPATPAAATSTVPRFEILMWDHKDSPPVEQAAEFKASGLSNMQDLITGNDALAWLFTEQPVDDKTAQAMLHVYETKQDADQVEAEAMDKEGPAAEDDAKASLSVHATDIKTFDLRDGQWEGAYYAVALAQTLVQEVPGQEDQVPDFQTMNQTEYPLDSENVPRFVSDPEFSTSEYKSSPQTFSLEGTTLTIDGKSFEVPQGETTNISQAFAQTPGMSAAGGTSHFMMYPNDESYFASDQPFSDADVRGPAKEDSQAAISSYELVKEAGAHELGDTDRQTIQKDYESRIKTASDFALAEMLVEYRTAGHGIQERWHTEFPKAFADVQKNRKKAEKEISKHTALHSLDDRMKFLAESMEYKHEEMDHSYLYEPLFETSGKQSWEQAKYAWKDEPLTEEAKLENQMPQETGPAREENENRGRQAPRSKVAASLAKEAKGERARIKKLKQRLDKTEDPVEITNINNAITSVEDRMERDDKNRAATKKRKEEKAAAKAEEAAEAQAEQPAVEAGGDIEKTKKDQYTWKTKNRKDTRPKVTDKKAGWEDRHSEAMGWAYQHMEELLKLDDATAAEQLEQAHPSMSTPDCLSIIQDVRANPEEAALYRDASQKAAGKRFWDEIQEYPQDNFMLQYKKVANGETYTKWFETKAGAEALKEQLKSNDQGTDMKIKDFSKKFSENNLTPIQRKAADNTHAHIRELKDKGMAVHQIAKEMMLPANIVTQILDTTADLRAYITKQAEIPSPWQSIKSDDDESEIIARITPEEVLKKSREDRGETEKQSKQATLSELLIQVRAYCKNLHKVAAVAISADEIAAADDEKPEKPSEPAPSLEGLTADEQTLWDTHYPRALSLAKTFRNKMARHLGDSETRQAAMIALLRVIRKFDPNHASMAKLESYLYRAVYNEVLTTSNRHKTLRQKAPGKIVDIDTPISEGDRLYEADTLADIIEDVKGVLPAEQMEQAESASHAREIVKQMRSRLVSNDLEVFELLAQGYRVSEIAKMKGWTIPNASRYRKKIAKVLEQVVKDVTSAPPPAEEPAPEQTPPADPEMN